MKRNKRKYLVGMIGICCAVLSGCGNVNENIETGMKAIEELKYEEALNSFDLATLAGEDEQLIARGKGIAYIGLCDYEKAVFYLTESLKNCDGHITKLEYDINEYLALAYFKSGLYSEAMETYSAVLAMDNNCVEAYYGRGISRLKNGMVELACEDFDRAVELDNRNYTLYMDIYSALAEVSEEALGEKYLNAALEAEDRRKSDYDQGRIYYYLKDYSSALSYFDVATRSTGRDAFLYLGKTYEALGDYNYAASVYTNYLNEHPDSAEIYNQLGVCKMTMESYEEALEAFQKGISIGNLHYQQALRMNEVTAYEYIGDFVSAKQKMEEYLATYPDDETAKREYRFLQTRTGNPLAEIVMEESNE